MNIDLNLLLKGKATRIKDKEYFTTEQYVVPFLERMSKLTNEFIIQVKPADQISLTPNGDVNFEDIIYNRVNIEAVLPNEYSYEGHKQVVGFVYALDTRKPVVKEYMGGLRTACLNLCTFNPAALSVQELSPEKAIDYNFLNYCLELADDMGARLHQLENMEFTKDQMYNELGMQIDRCINFKFHNDFGTVKLPESLPIEVYKNLFYNEKSDYYTQNNSVSGFDVYQAYTDIICNGKSKDLVNRFEKTLLVSRIMGVD
jgi:hypothetical protein